MPFGRVTFRNVFLFPMALSFVVTGTIWRWLFLDLGWIERTEKSRAARITEAGRRGLRDAFGVELAPTAAA